MRRKITREDIIKAGYELVFVKGYHATGIRDITQAIAIPKGSFYNHFQTKEEFGLALLEYYADHFSRRQLAMLSDTAFPPLTRLKRFFLLMSREYQDLSCTRGCLLGKLGQELGDDGDIFSAALDKHYIAFHEAYRLCLLEAAQQGEIPQNLEIAFLAEFIGNAWQGALTRMKASRSAAPLEIFMRVCFEKILAN